MDRSDITTALRGAIFGRVLWFYVSMTVFSIVVGAIFGHFVMRFVIETFGELAFGPAFGLLSAIMFWVWNMVFESRRQKKLDATLASIIKALDNMAESHRTQSSALTEALNNMAESHRTQNNMMIEEYKKQTALIIEKFDSMQHQASKAEEPQP